MELETAVKALREFFKTCAEPIVCAYIFGSLAREEPRVEDVDIAVLYSRTMPAKIDSPHSALALDLEDVLKKSVDLIDLERASPDLIHRILRDGRLILDRCPSRRIAFEVKARNEYFDMEPIRSEYRRLGDRHQ